MRTSFFVLAIWLAFFVLGVVGWVMNIINIVHMDPILTGVGVARVIGVFIAPLGSLLGWFL